MSFCTTSYDKKLEEISCSSNIVTKNLVITDSDNESEDDDIVGSLMPSYITNEMNQFRNDLAKLMERTLD